MNKDRRLWALKALDAILLVAVLALVGCFGEQELGRQRRTMSAIENSWKIIRPGIFGGLWLAQLDQNGS